MLIGILQQIADVTSEEVAIQLAKEVGGTEISVPRYPKEHHSLSQLIGLENAQKISREIGNGRMLIPASHFRGAGARRAFVDSLIVQGYSITEIARMADCHERTVLNAKARLRNKTESQQFSFFD